MTPNLVTSRGSTSRRSHRLRWAAGLAALATLALAPAVVGSAAPARAASALAPAVSPAKPNVPVMVVLDASGSMNEADAPGPRIDAAKAAVTTLVTALPAGTNVGFSVYGATTGSGAADKVKGCQDIRTLVPVSPLDRAAITSAVNGVTASGYTPIGGALRAAAQALPKEGARSIVLVSDGEDTCAPPAPCDVAKDLKKQGVDLTVHTVGFKVDHTARAQLSCIATQTGGTYADAADADQLTSALKTKVDYAITGYAARGTKIAGADRLSQQAPLMKPGQYLDTYAQGGAKEGAAVGTTKYYTVPLPPGGTLYASATVVTPTHPGGSSQSDFGTYGVTVSLRSAGDRSCNSDHAFQLASSSLHAPTTAVLHEALTESNSGGSLCSSGGIGILRVQRTGTAYADEALPMELVVRVEPPADLAGVPPAFTSAQPALAAPAFGRSTALAAGSSFNDAPTLTSGATVTDTIVTGEDHFYRVRLAWGQRFSYRVRDLGRAVPQLREPVAAYVNTYNPLRSPVDVKPPGGASRMWFSTWKHDDFTGSTQVPARYTNRTGPSPLNTMQVDGDYYLRVGANFSKVRSSVRYQLVVVVQGTPEAGPAYLTGATKTTPTTTSPPTTPAPSPSTTSGVVISEGQSARVVGTQSASPLPLALGVAAILAAAAAAGVVITRRRRATATNRQP